MPPTVWPGIWQYTSTSSQELICPMTVGQFEVLGEVAQLPWFMSRTLTPFAHTPYQPRPCPSAAAL
ncbi:hypothetical protein WKI71_41170 [Streptomyces sp. MS1.AVA.1]|uniref:Uncharacterized protein n=1 Tax=Streptomyces machairae TaxID=3134109 RepID=A0ABU8UW53_9ACTN